MRLRVATRGSRLSLRQVDIVYTSLRERLPGLVFEKVVVRTRGDLVRDKPLYAIGGKGLFEKEVNQAVLRGEADIAVHSAKDLPSEIDPRLEIAYVPPRDKPNDAIVAVGRPAPSSPREIPRGSTVGTSSVRRQALLRHYNPAVRVEPMRGNVDTRVEKLRRGQYDYAVMAAAGLERLGLDKTVSMTVLPVEEFPPAPGQGLIAVVAPRDSRVAEMLRRHSDPRAKAMLEAERAFLAAAGAGCHTPLGGVALPASGEALVFIAVLLSPDGSRAVWVREKGWLDRAEELGRRVGETIYSARDRLGGEQWAGAESTSSEQAPETQS